MKKEGKNVVNYEFVDLGLSVQWANMNVGAEKVEDFGKYYSWDEVINSKNVDWEEDGRMPREEEIDELISKCEWEWK
jgi:hypothetical protein